jgi:hypothetical protein
MQHFEGRNSWPVVLEACLALPFALSTVLVNNNGHDMAESKDDGCNMAESKDGLQR